MNGFKGRVAVVTGAASGIGLAMAQRFAREGMKLVLADVEDAKLEQVRAQFVAAGTQVLAVKVDVRQESQVNALADQAYAHFGAVHVLCNNAGVAATALTTRAWESTIGDWQWTYDVNFMGVLYGVRAFVPRMIAAGDEGHVVNTASVAGLLTSANPYHISKHAVACLTEGLYKDLKSMNSKISASVLCPGLINTAILNAERNRPAQYGARTKVEAQPEHVQRWIAGFHNALANGYDPSQVADAVADAIAADRYYIIPAQENLQDLIRTRMQDILEQRNPTVPAPRY